MGGFIHAIALIAEKVILKIGDLAVRGSDGGWHDLQDVASPYGRGSADSFSIKAENIRFLNQDAPLSRLNTLISHTQGDLSSSHWELMSLRPRRGTSPGLMSSICLILKVKSPNSIQGIGLGLSRMLITS